MRLFFRLLCVSVLKLGHSHWSDWCTPVTPRAGVYLLEANDDSSVDVLTNRNALLAVSGARQVASSGV